MACARRGSPPAALPRGRADSRRRGRPPEPGALTEAPTARGARRGSRALVVALGVALSALFLWLAARRVDLGEAADAIRGVDLWWLALGVILINVALVPMAVRWRIATEGLAPRELPSTRGFLVTVLSAQGVNNVLPARPGDVLRVAWLARASGAGAARATASMLADRALDVLTLCVIIAVGFPLVRHEPWIVGVGLAGLAGSLALVALWVWCRRGAARGAFAPGAAQGGLIRRQLSRFGEAFGSLLSARRAGVMALWTLGMWGVWAAGAWAIAHGMDIALTYPQVLFATAVLSVGLAIPSSPGFVGTYQWLIVSSLGLFAVGADDAFAYAIVQQLAWFVPQTLAGLALLPRLGLSIAGARSEIGGDAPADPASLPPLSGPEHTAAPGAPEEARAGRGAGWLRRAASDLDVRICLGLSALVSLLAMSLMRMWGNFRVPQGMTGDFTFASLLVKGITEHGWFLRNENLGWPTGHQMLDLPLGSNNLNNLMMWVIGLFTNDFTIVINLYLLLTFPLTAVSAYVVARRLSISPASAAFAGLLYAFIPYHFRGQVILFVIGFWALPFGLLLAIRVLQGVPLFARDPARSGLRAWATRRSVATVATCVAMGSISFYLSAFAVVAILTGALAHLFRRSSRRVGLSALVAAFLVFGTVLVNDSPSLLQNLRHGDNAQVGNPGEFESEIYGLTLTRMVIPPSFHRFDPAADFGRHYEQTTPLAAAGEQSAYVGIVAGVGIAGLLVFALAAMTVGLSAERRRRYGPLAAIALVAFAFATVGGGNSIFSYAVLPLLRGLGRISTVLAFCGILAVAFALDGLARRLGRRAWAMPLVLVPIAIVGIYDQSGNGYTAEHRRATKAQWQTDARFVAAIERAVPRSTAVYTLPEQTFPDGAGVGRLSEYDGAQGYLHSSTLKWSFGGMRGREGRWFEAMSRYGLPAKLRRISACGFGGIWVDGFGYGDPAPVVAELRQLTGAEPVASGDGRRWFFSLADYNRREEGTRSAAERRAYCDRVLRPMEPIPGPGFGVAQTDGVTNWRLLAADTRFGVRSDLDAPRDIRVTLTMRTTSASPASVTITGPGNAVVAAVVGTAPTVIRMRATLPPGSGSFQILANADPPGFPNPAQAIRLDSLDLSDAPPYA